MNYIQFINEQGGRELNRNPLDNRMTVPEIARELGVKPATVYNWSHKGTYPELLKFQKSVNGRLFIMREDVEAFKREYIGGRVSEVQQAN